MTKVFLGGTCNESAWRNSLIEMLEIDYFNPVVEDWTEACMAEEIKQRETCDFCLYVITPKMTGVYSIAEVVDDSNKRPERTIICVLDQDFGLGFSEGQRKSLAQVQAMVVRNGGKSFNYLDEVASHLNLIEKVAGKTLDEWWNLAVRDDCFSQMVPSDLRALVTAATRVMEGTRLPKPT